MSVPFVGIWLEAPESTLVARAEQRRNDASDADADVIRIQHRQRDWRDDLAPCRSLYVIRECAGVRGETCSGASTRCLQHHGLDDVTCVCESHLSGLDDTRRCKPAVRTRGPHADRTRGSGGRGRLLRPFDGVSCGLPALKALLVRSHVCVAELA